MGFPVTYYCPHCGTFVELDRDGYLADKAVTPYPFEGWRYVAPTEPFEDDDADGVEFVCGESGDVEWVPERSRTSAERDDAQPDTVKTGPTEPEGKPGCGERFYLSFVRYQEGREIDPRPETELVEIDPDPRPSGPNGPRGPTG